MSYALRHHPLGCTCGMHGLGLVDPITGTIMSPGAIAGYLSTIDAAVQALARDIGARRAALAARGQAGFLREWDLFVSTWGTWRDDHSGFFARLTGSTPDEANEWARRYNGWEVRYREVTGEAPSAPAGTQRGSSGEYVPYVIAGASVVGLIAVGYVIAGVAKIYQAHAVEKAASGAVDRAVSRATVRRNRRRRRHS